MHQIELAKAKLLAEAAADREPPLKRFDKPQEKDERLDDELYERLGD